MRRPPNLWLEGQSRVVFGKFHIVMNGAPDSRGRFPTMCGTHARPGIRPFSELRATSCKTCSKLARTRPAATPCRPAHELLSTKGHLVQVGRALALAQRSEGGLTITALEGLIQRALEPVQSDLGATARSDSTSRAPGRA